MMLVLQMEALLAIPCCQPGFFFFFVRSLFQFWLLAEAKDSTETMALAQYYTRIREAAGSWCILRGEN